MRGRQTTNLLLQAGAEAVKGKPASVPGLAPLRAIKELHRQAADELGVDEAAHTQVEALLGELQQLLIGIAIMQARLAPLKMTAELPWKDPDFSAVPPFEVYLRQTRRCWASCTWVLP